MQLKLMYSVRDLTILLGLPYEKRIAVRRLLKRAGIGLHYSKGPRSKGYVLLADLKEKCPRLWHSMLESFRVRRTA